MGFLLAVFSGIIAAAVASHKHRSPLFWFIIGLFANIFGIIMILLLPSKQRTSHYHTQNRHQSRSNDDRSRISVQCPHCHEEVFINEPGLWNCPHCHQGFEYNQNGRVYKMDDVLTPDIAALVTLFAKVSKADGVVTQNEIQVVDRIIKTELQPSDSRMARIRKTFNDAKGFHDNYMLSVHQLYNFFNHEPNILRGILQFIIEISEVDQPVHPDQQKIIDDATNYFKLNDYDRNESTNRNVSHIDKYYKVLGCTVGDSDETIKKRYRQLIKEYHPDKFMNQNLPQDFIDLANQKIKEVTEAYEEIMKHRRSA